MKKPLFMIAAALMAGATIFAPAAHAGELAVQVQGVRDARGAIMAQLLRADPASGTAKPIAATMRPAQPGAVELVFPGLQPGDYAVMLFHDENGNGQLDSNAFGVPAEGFAFSNGAVAKFGPPKFGEMKVAVTAARTVTIAAMTY